MNQKPVIFSGEADTSAIAAFSFRFRANSSGFFSSFRARNKRWPEAHVVFTAQYFERLCCSYDVRLFVTFYDKNSKKVPVQIHIGFLDRFPDRGSMHNRHRLVMLLYRQEFLRVVLRMLEEYLQERAETPKALNLFVRVLRGEKIPVNHMCVVAKLAEDDTSVLFSDKEMSKSLFLADRNHASEEAVVSSETECLGEIITFLQTEVFASLLVKG